MVAKKKATAKPKVKAPAKKAPAKKPTKAKPPKKMSAPTNIQFEDTACPDVTPPDVLDEAIKMIEQGVSMLGWHMAVGMLEDGSTVVGICAGDDQYLLDMVGHLPPKE